MQEYVDTSERLQCTGLVMADKHINVDQCFECAALYYTSYALTAKLCISHQLMKLNTISIISTMRWQGVSSEFLPRCQSKMPLKVSDHER